MPRSLLWWPGLLLGRSMDFKNAKVEKDVENIYRAEILAALPDGQITSPFGCDGVLVSKTCSLRTLLEFKYDLLMKKKINQVNVLMQCLYYLKKFEDAGEKLPDTIFIGDINECFALHTNAVVKYLSRQLDWKIAPSEAHRKNPEVCLEMLNDQDIEPFVHDVDAKFSIKEALDKLKELSQNIVRRVRITEKNITVIYNYFDENVIKDCKLSVNEKANLFIQIVINPNENYLHPKKKGVLTTKSFGELRINHSVFGSFFKHFEGDIYSPKEKENLTGLVDRLIEDTTRRKKGEFFTPTPFVDLAHQYIAEAFGESWRDDYVVWDSCAGTLNLTRDYKFKELYCSTIEQSDLDTANQMGYNPEAIKFQFDFLNDSDSKLPDGLKLALKTKKVLFLINPPYATAGNMGTKEGDHKAGVAINMLNERMKKEKWGKSAQSTYGQFLYRITKYKENNPLIDMGLFCTPLYLSGGSYKEFRKKFFSVFGFKSGFLMQASHFDNVSKGWGVAFSVFGEANENKTEFAHDVFEIEEDFSLSKKTQKTIYNLDNHFSLCNTIIKIKGKEKKPAFSSAFTKPKKDILYNVDSLGMLISDGNNVYTNSQGVALFSTAASIGHLQSKTIIPENIPKVTALFTARKTIKSNWINQKDEYMAPNEDHPDYQQFVNDSLVYSLFNNSSQQSSLRQITYKEKLWDIKNEFFWMEKDEISNLANEEMFDELYKDARLSEERHVYKLLFKEGGYEKLSPDAKELLDYATNMVKNSISYRDLLHQAHPEYHLNAWDAGYAQLKLVWKEYMPEEFKTFRAMYKKFEDRLIPLVYQLGFLKE